MGASSTPTFQNLGDIKSGDHTKDIYFCVIVHSIHIQHN